MKRVALLPALLVTGLLAGCGSAGDPSGPSVTGAPAGPGAPMSVGITDGRLGGAVTDTRDGRERELALGGGVDPSVLRPARRDREGVAAGDACANATLQPDPGNLGTIETATLCLLNGERADRGLRPLSIDRRLERAARAHGGDMVEHRYFSHDGRNGSRPAQRIRAAGYLSGGGSWRIGENLAWGTGELATPRSIMAAWMNSPGHRANILQPAYREIGFAVLAGNPSSGGDGATYVTEFGVVDRPQQVASRRGSASARSERRAERRAASRRAKTRRARSRARRARARRARARVALAPRSRRGRKVGRVVAVRAGLR
jgi:uncharacterized protein YkwD